MLGEAIEERRKIKGWTQTHLAKMMGTFPQNIHGFEKGKRRMSFEMVERFNTVFGGDPSVLVHAWLVDLTEDKYDIDVCCWETTHE